MCGMVESWIYLSDDCEGAATVLCGWGDCHFLGRDENASNLGSNVAIGRPSPKCSDDPSVSFHPSGAPTRCAPLGVYSIKNSFVCFGRFETCWQIRQVMLASDVQRFSWPWVRWASLWGASLLGLLASTCRPLCLRLLQRHGSGVYAFKVIKPTDYHGIFSSSKRLCALEPFVMIMFMDFHCTQAYKRMYIRSQYTPVQSRESTIGINIAV